MSAFEKWWDTWRAGARSVTPQNLTNFAEEVWNAATLAERERCAMVCQDEGWEPGHIFAAAIRAEPKAEEGRAGCGAAESRA